MTDFERKDNEFVAWYPPDVHAEHADTVWAPRRAAYYVHVPFCQSICHYCGFSVERLRDGLVERYLSALELEIERYAAAGRLAGREFVCGHFGGGTPSVLTGPQLVRIIDQIRGAYAHAPSVELTVEVNPISFDEEKACAYAEAGVNRISFGVQSFHDDLLRVIGRGHRRRDVDRTLAAIRAAEIENFSLDIIYGVPGQTPAQLREDLARAADTGATHLSCFRLEIIPFTVLKLREAAGLLPPRLDDAALNAMDEIVSEVLTARGYREYGAFNFARPGFESVHNEIAFVAPQAEYVGFGNSAYSFLSRHVYCNHAVVRDYENALFEGRDPIALARPLTALDEMARYFVLGVKFLRVPRAPFAERFGLQPEDVFGAVLDRLSAEGLLEATGDEYVLTRRGRQYVNNVAKCFYVGESRGVSQYQQFVPNVTATQIERYAAKALHG